MRSLALLLMLVGCGHASAPLTVAAPGWLKGQLHVHTGRSGDSKTPPTEVAAWYAAHGYDFIVFTDHAFVGGLDGEAPAGLLVLPGVEITQNGKGCTPAPDPDEPCLLHVNAIAVDDGTLREVTVGPLEDMSRLAIFGRAIDSAIAMGGLAQINHPNFHYAADATLIIALARRGAVLLEVANNAVDSNNEGDATHPDTFALWDAATDAGVTLWGTATDDAHHYADAASVRARGELAYEGDRGWVVVHAARDAKAIRAALAAGDFYASDGVVLTGVQRSPGHLTVTTAAPATIVCSGSGGHEIARSPAATTSFTCTTPPGSWTRATITDPAGHHAWTQPIH